MDATNPFAQTPMTPEPIIAQVRRQLLAEADENGLMPDHSVDELVDQVVRELWSSRVKTFVPVLALRQTRELLHQRTLAAPPQPAEPPQAGDLPPLRAGRDPRDVIGSGSDALPLDRRDVLRVDERDVLQIS